MINKTKIALSLALIFSTAPGAFAATKHHRHPTATPATVSTSAFGANASVGTRPNAFNGSNGAMLIQDRDYSAEHSNPYCGGRC